MAGRCDYRRLQPTRAGPPPLSRRRSLDPGAAAAARAADRNLTSQLFANIYLDGFDHFCTEILRPKGYLRYVDDLALFHDDPSVLDDYRDRIAVFLAGRRLSLILARRRSAGRTNPQPSSAMCCRRAGGVCRKKFTPLPQPLARSARSRSRGQPGRGRSRTAYPLVDRACRARRYLAPASCPLSGRPVRSRLRSALPRWPAGPQAEAWPVPRRLCVLRGGSWNNNPRNRRSAYRNRNDTDNRNNNIGFRVARTPSTCPSRRVHRRAGSA